ncbi:LCP family protein [Nocardia neocaledoniensis]|uniref:LCP family protein n=1 Tax=Nocardia neocaledoniensis TaxID=236511 RepID=UPI001FC9DBA6|nr:LCP family protein [Nocardia neocaledoniensis]
MTRSGAEARRARRRRQARHEDPARQARRLAKSAVVLAAVLVVTGTGGAWGYMRSTDNGFTQVGALDLDSTDVVDPGAQVGDETFLIVGTDSRAGANGQVGAGSADAVEGARADTVMLVNIPANRQRAVAVSFPRDLDVYRPQCQAWDNPSASYTEELMPAADGAKLNSTYALGGPRCLVKVIQKITGIKIGHFIGIDFAGFEAMVDQIGGVQVCTPTPLIDDILGPVLPRTGPQLVDGETALNYVRARHIRSDGTSDYGRIKRQQRFLSSLLRSAMSNKVLFDPAKLNGFISAFTRQTFVENVTTKDLLALGRSLQGVNAGAITFLTVPTSGTNDVGNEIPRTTDIKAIFGAIIDDTPLPGEQRNPAAAPTVPAAVAPAPPPGPALTVSPAQISVRVANATTISGLAAVTADSLADSSFQIYEITNHLEPSTRTVIRHNAALTEAAQTLAAAIPGAVLEQTSSSAGYLDLILGSDFTGSVNSTTLGESGPQLAEIPADLTVTNAADDTCT